jgi:hypothetical protein
MKIGYKGFNKNLECRGDKFQIEETYSKNNDLDHLRLGSSDGFHYCSDLVNVFDFYPDDGYNRFCEIEILGAFNEDSKKSITTSFKILRELTKSEIKEIQMESYFKLDLLREIQTKYPNFIVGGSTSLFLRGVRLERWNDNYGAVCDYDIITSYFILPESTDALHIDYGHGKTSGNDFDYTFTCNGVKIDYRIDPKQKYEFVEYKGHKYKVSSLLDVLDAKVKYAKNGDQKHIEDLNEMVINKK